MGLNIPDGIEAKCDQEGCTSKTVIPIRYIHTGFKKSSLINKLRKAGWYISKKNETILCPSCADSMGVKRKKVNKENQSNNIDTWSD